MINNDIWNNIKIIKSLGKGNSGEIFLINLNNKEYAMKRQKITDFYYKYIKNEFLFYQWIDLLNNNDKKFFMELYYYRKYNNCNFEFIPKQGEQEEELKKSKTCVDLIVGKKDGMINQIISNLSKNEILSAFIQTLYSIYLMNKKGYIHSDTKADNIFYNNTNSNNINISKFGIIPSFGYQFGLIDYGYILNEKFDLDEYDREIIEIHKIINFDLSYLINDLLLNNVILYQQIDKNKTFFDIKEIYKIIKNIPEKKYNKVLNFIKIKENVDYINDLKDILEEDDSWETYEKIFNRPKYASLIYEIIQIYQIKYPKSFYKNLKKIFNVDFKKEYILEKKELLYIKKNQQNIKKIIKFYIKKININSF